MGMNKLYLSEYILKGLYSSNGIEYVIEFLNKPETIIYTDEFSFNIMECVKSDNRELLIKYLK